MIGEIAQYILIAAILGGILLISRTQARRQGQANPFDTGALGQQIDNLGGRLAAIKIEVDDSDRRLGELEKNAAKVHDIKRVEKAIEGLDRTLDRVAEDSTARGATLDHVKETVDRLMKVIVERGMK